MVPRGAITLYGPKYAEIQASNPDLTCGVRTMASALAQSAGQQLGGFDLSLYAHLGRGGPWLAARPSGSSPWYLLAYCRTARAGRWFRLDRIQRAHLTRQQADEHDVEIVIGEPPPEARPVSVSPRPRRQDAVTESP